jgi:heavy metal sensor kinase
MSKLFKDRTFSLRTRLTAWYAVVLGVMLTLFCVYLHVRLESALLDRTGSLTPLMEEVSDRLLQEMLMAVPLVLMAASVGGLFLADRALRSIDQIAQIAQEISVGSDLSRRIGYKGATDEIGRLSQTIDRMLARLQSSFEQEKRFTADASHELRTPLTAIKGRIGMILQQPRTTTQYQETLQQIEHQVDRMVRLTNDLLFLSRLDSNHLPWNPISLDLSQLLETVLEQMQQLADERQLSLVKKIEPNLFIQGDPDYLIRVFVNLLDNAIKYTPAQGQVTVRVMLQGGEACVMVSDTGTGIAAEHLAYLFDRFYRVESARSRQTGGTGLGIAIAHEIVRFHSGVLTIQSQLDQGSIFTVLLPCSAQK